MNETIVAKLNEEVSKRIGHTIGTDHIHTDENGWYYYIPAKSLLANHPLVLNHYRGPLFIVIPYKDGELLDQETISVEDYIENSTWSFGYYWGGGSLLGGIRWMPFEEKGIHETEKIKRYFTILGCRTSRISSGWQAEENDCANCSVKNCPFSRFHENASWDNEVKEEDDRIKLFKAVKRRIYERFGLKAVSCMSQDSDTIRMFVGFEKNTVSVYLPQALMIDMLYNPGKYNISEVANSLKFEVGTSWHIVDDEVVPEKHEYVPEDADCEFLFNYWKDERSFCNWFPKEESTPKSSEENHSEQGGNRFINLIMRIFKKVS